MKNVKEMEEVIEDFGDSLSKINTLSEKIESAGNSILDTEEKIKDMLSIKDTVSALYENTKSTLKEYREDIKDFEKKSFKMNEEFSAELKKTQEKIDNQIYQINTMTGKFDEKLSSLRQEIADNQNRIHNETTDYQNEIRKQLLEHQNETNKMVDNNYKQLQDIINTSKNTFKRNLIFNIVQLGLIIVILTLVIVFVS